MRPNLIMSSLFVPAACLHVACVVQQKDARQWFAELSVDMDKVRLNSLELEVYEAEMARLVG